MNERLFSLVQQEPYGVDLQTGQLELLTAGRWGDFPLGDWTRLLTGATAEGLIGITYADSSGTPNVSLISADGAASWAFSVGQLDGAPPSEGWQISPRAVSDGYVHIMATAFDGTQHMFLAVPIASIKSGAPTVEKTTTTAYGVEEIAAVDHAIVFPRYSSSDGWNIFVAPYDAEEFVLYDAPNGDGVNGVVAAAQFDDQLYVVSAGRFGTTKAQTVRISPQGVLVADLPYVAWAHIASPGEIWLDTSGGRLLKTDAQLELLEEHRLQMPAASYSFAFFKGAGPPPPAACFWTDLVGVSQVCGAPAPAPEPGPDRVTLYAVNADASAPEGYGALLQIPPEALLFEPVWVNREHVLYSGEGGGGMMTSYDGDIFGLSGPAVISSEQVGGDEFDADIEYRAGYAFIQAFGFDAGYLNLILAPHTGAPAYEELYDFSTFEDRGPGILTVGEQAWNYAWLDGRYQLQGAPPAQTVAGWGTFEQAGVVVPALVVFLGSD